VKAIDKAGNEQIGVYDPSTAPERQAPPYGSLLAIIAILVFILGGAFELYRIRARARAVPPPPPPIA